MSNLQIGCSEEIHGNWISSAQAAQSSCGCPIPMEMPKAWLSPGQPELVGGVPAHGRRCALRSYPKPLFDCMKYSYVLLSVSQSPEEVFMEIRRPLEWHCKQMDHFVGLNFNSNFNFALVGHLLKGKSACCCSCENECVVSFATVHYFFLQEYFLSLCLPVSTHWRLICEIIDATYAQTSVTMWFWIEGLN